MCLTKSLHIITIWSLIVFGIPSWMCFQRGKKEKLQNIPTDVEAINICFCGYGSTLMQWNIKFTLISLLEFRITTEVVMSSRARPRRLTPFLLGISCKKPVDIWVPWMHNGSLDTRTTASYIKSIVQAINFTLSSMNRPF